MVQWLKNNSEFSLSFFELMLLSAILHFRRENVQAAVFEVGLGGKRDATACLSPALSILTNVSLDHTHILGETISEIAEEKSGVIKAGSNFIWAGQEELTPFFNRKCTELQTSFQRPDKNDFLTNINSSLSGISGEIIWKQQALTVQTRLKGLYQLQNIATVICACRQLQKLFTIDEGSIQKGLANAVHECRLETICENPLIIVDGSHNFHGLQTLAEWISIHLKNYQVFVALGIKNNKQHAMIQNIWSENVKLLLYSGREKKFLNSNGLRRNYPDGEVLPDYKTIYHRFLIEKNPLKALIFTGSLYLAARQKRYFNKNHKK
jgi:dihydrofolate synthase/folylpolyglutamate synthase